MQHSSAQPEQPTQARPHGLVIAAIGLQLLLCSIASAANACSDSLDRSARRLPAQVAQAFREMADRTVATTAPATDFGPGYSIDECPRAVARVTPTPPTNASAFNWARRLLNLPPPVRA
jgi:hypothetical protein